MMNGARQRRLRRRRAMRMGGAGNRERYLPWLILGGAVLLGLGLAILLGNVLGKQTEGLPAGRDDISVTYGNIRVPGVTCEAFAFGYAVDNMKANGTNAVSVVLRGADDTLGYRSETAIHMKRQADGAVAENAGPEISYLQTEYMSAGSSGCSLRDWTDRQSLPRNTTSARLPPRSPGTGSTRFCLTD